MSDRLGRQTSLILRAGTVLGIGIMALGLFMTAFGFPEDVLNVGICVLVLTPMAGVAVSIKCLWQEGDRRWTGVALVLVAAIAVGMALTFFGL